MYSNNYNLSCILWIPDAQEEVVNSQYETNLMTGTLTFLANWYPVNPTYMWNNKTTPKFTEMLDIRKNSHINYIIVEGLWHWSFYSDNLWDESTSSFRISASIPSTNSPTPSCSTSFISWWPIAVLIPTGLTVFLAGRRRCGCRGKMGISRRKMGVSPLRMWISPGDLCYNVR